MLACDNSRHNLIHGRNLLKFVFLYPKKFGAESDIYDKTPTFVEKFVIMEQTFLETTLLIVTES